MSSIIDKRRENNHTRDEYGSVISFSRVYLKLLALKVPNL